MSVIGQRDCHSSECSDTDKFTAVSDLFKEIKYLEKKRRSGDIGMMRGKKEDEFTIDKLLLPWSYE